MCHSEGCQNLVRNKGRLICYHTTGPEGFYVRRNQMDFSDVCRNEGDVCSFQMLPSGSVVRGCAPKNAGGEGLILCSSHRCNWQIGGIYCFTCQATDPNCVFSQHEGPLEMCAPPSMGCFTRIFDDSSVQRGCAKVRDNTTLGSRYVFCDDASLCNKATTKSHSCHILQLNVAFRPPRPVPPAYWKTPTQTGWMFESCPDVNGFPACYMRVTHKTIVYGCTADLANYELVGYQRASQVPAINLCDGHYCNSLPDIKDPRRRNSG